MYNKETDPQRSRPPTAIIEFGLKPAQAAYDGRSQYGTGVNAEHNWNQVCNGGIGIGALAIGDEEPKLAGRVLHEALRRLPRAMVHYGPDGAWNEGPGYWHYATRYNVYILAALESALGHDFGLSDIQGFADAGTFPIYVTGPTGRTFNFADGGDNPIRAEEMFWLARRFDRPEYARYQASRAEPNALDLLWYDAGLLQGGESKPPPLDRYFRGSEVVTMRSSWDDPEAMFVALKAGDNKANHSNLDIGSFVLEAGGQRWVVDPGRDNYNLPGYWERGVDGRRWTYYRMRAESHNTLVLNPGKGPDQDPAAAARVVQYLASPEKALAIADLTPAYWAHARSVRRSVQLLRGDSTTSPAVLIEDEISSDAALDSWWFLHTPAAVEILESGRLAKLDLGGKQLYVRLRGPEQAAFEVADAAPLASSPNPAGQAANTGIRRIAIHLQGVRDARIVVELSRSPGVRLQAPGNGQL
ncbi:MAG: heparinase II/III domain-containing protein [Acidobacteriota bacterium]